MGNKGCYVISSNLQLLSSDVELFLCHFLQTYEWALEAMKYVASMKMEHCATPEGLEKLLRSLELYLQDHPPIPDDTFNNMADIAGQLKNDKLLEQCQTAHNRCKETQRMLTLRGNTLQQFKDQLELEASAFKSPKSTSALPGNQRNITDTVKQSSPSAISQVPPVSSHEQHSVKNNWEPKQTSTPIVPSAYSRTQSAERAKSMASLSSSSTSSSPAHSVMSPSSPCHISNLPCPSTDTSPSHLYTPSSSEAGEPDSQCEVIDQDYGANTTGYISQRVTTALPKVLTDKRFQMSKENLSDDLKSELRENFPVLPEDGLNNQLPSVSAGVVQRSRPAKKILRRAISTPQTGISPPINEEDSGAIIDTQGNRISSLRQNGRTDSMITGSSDSLPRLVSSVYSLLSKNLRKRT